MAATPAPATPPVAAAMATTTPKDDLVAADGRGKTPVSQLVKLKPEAAPEFTNVLRSYVDGKLDLKTVLTAAKNGTEVDKEGVKENLAALKKESAGTMAAGKEADEDFEESSLDKYKALLTKDNFNFVKDSGGNIYNVASGTRTDKVKALSVAVANLTKQPGFLTLVDSQAEMAMALTILDTAIQLGVPDIIDRVLQNRADAKERKRLRIQLLESSSYAIGRADLDTINKIINHLGATEVMTRNPNAIQDILRYYRLPYDIEPKDYLAERLKLIETLARLVPKWDKVYNTSNIQPFIWMSAASKFLLNLPLATTNNANQLTETYAKQASLGEIYWEEKSVDTVRRMFPKVARLFSTL